MINLTYKSISDFMTQGKLPKEWLKSKHGKFKISDAKLYVSVVTLSTQDNAKLLQQLKSGFKKNN